MKVVVTGGAGFLGRHVCDELSATGHHPVILDRPFDVLDICDIEPYDAVIHLAGVLGTAELFDDFDRAVDTNIKGTHRVLEYCRAHNARFVGITMPSVWANVYQATKLCGRTLATAWHESFGVPVSHVRAYNAFGVGQAVGPGHPQKIIPTFSRLAWEGKPIPIWGDGEQTVDLIYAVECASVLVQAIDHGDDQMFEAGTGAEWTVNEVAEFVLQVTQSDSPIHHYPMRPGEREHTKLCATGEGWELLDRPPRFDIGELIGTINSYRP